MNPVFINVNCLPTNPPDDNSNEHLDFLETIARKNYMQIIQLEYLYFDGKSVREIEIIADKAGLEFEDYVMQELKMQGF